MDKLFY